MSRIQSYDTPYSAARRLSECNDSATRVAALGILTELIEKVDHSADLLGPLGLLMDMDRRGVHGAEVLNLHQRCNGDLNEMARQMRGQPLAKPAKKEAAAPPAPSIGVDQIVSELATRLEALAFKTDSVELLEDAETLKRGNTTIRKSEQGMSLLTAILRQHKLGDNYKGIKKVVFGA